MSAFTQKTITLVARSRGMHLITDEIVKSLSGLPTVKCGLLNLFLQHTSASLTINENTDPDVRADLEMSLSRLVPESWPYRHDAEGSDDMPAHVKASLFGPSLTIPIKEGRLALGTWQGIYLAEHRENGGARSIVATVLGD